MNNNYCQFSLSISVLAKRYIKQNENVIMGFLSSIAQYILIVVNFIILSFAVCLIALGIYNLKTENQGLKDIASLSTVGSLVTTGGFILFFISCFGCYGAYTQSSVLLSIYVSVLVSSVIFNVVVLAFVYYRLANQNKFERDMTLEVKELFDKYNENSTDKELVDMLQKNIKCCGVIDVAYWRDNIPTSCCINKSNPCTRDKAYKIGCGKAVTNEIVNKFSLMSKIVLAFGIGKLVAAFLACIIVRDYKSSEDES